MGAWYYLPVVGVGWPAVALLAGVYPLTKLGYLYLLIEDESLACLCVNRCLFLWVGQ